MNYLKSFKIIWITIKAIFLKILYQIIIDFLGEFFLQGITLNILMLEKDKKTKDIIIKDVRNLFKPKEN